ncbi:hypothetical protein ACJIZ3_005721 [Penstemon smallii]|uniref:C3H1-type domain-containing protein n=1 Tax=Penstemon smallii TaxID=265156 RepID=A0ABD3S5P0_9LAMI
MNADLLNVLELAANNDLEGFKTYIDREPSSLDEIGLWYGRQKGSSKMVLHHRTPLMVAATYGSIDVLKLIISIPEVEINRSCGIDKTTALHCAASGGSVNAIDVVKLLLVAGADPNIPDSNGLCPFHVIVISPNLQEMKSSLQMMLSIEASLQEEYISNFLNGSSFSPNSEKIEKGPVSEKKEYPVDSSLPDIKNGIYSTDEFRMFSFKVRPCSRAYSHDWTECPFVHPGENARRRDPRKFHYSCVPCPEFRKGACRRGDMCEYAHGVFECWLHPAQYRTRLCKDGTSCNRRVCFFAHTQEELRPLYVSTGSAVPSPRSSASRLRSSLNARDIPFEDLSLYSDIEILNELSNMSNPKNLSPLNLDNNIFSAGSSSPRYYDTGVLLSPIRTKFSQRNVDQSLLQVPFGVLSPGRMSPRSIDPVSPMSARFSILAQHENFRSLSLRDLGQNGPSKWGSPNGPGEWAGPVDEIGKLKRSSSSELLNNGEEPDLSWVHSLVKESPQDDMNDQTVPRVVGSSGTGTSSSEGVNVNLNTETEQVEQSLLGAWFDQMQLDQLMAQ